MSMLRKNLARDYALTLSWRYAEVEFLGLPKLKDDRVFRLEHIYVPLRLCRDLGERSDREKTLYVPKALQEDRRLVVLGDPGSGKSTLVKVLTYAFGEADSNAYKRACGELIPIPIILRDYKTRQWQNYHDLLNAFMATLDEDIRREITPEWLLEHLRDGKAILLIDGLDEVGLREERLRLRDKVIFPLLNESLSSYVLLTSRIVGYDEVPFHFLLSPPLEGVENDVAKRPLPFAVPLLKRYYVAPFDDEEIAQFITRWYQLRENFPERQREGVESLMRALNQNDRVKRLAHNPQLLTLMALMHRVTANLPSGRVELYDKIVEAYLETIQVYRKLGTPAKLDEMKRWLAKVGWEMQNRRDQEIKKPGSKQADDLLVSRDEIRKWLIEAITKERDPVGAPELADLFLDYVARRSGLLVPRGPEEFSFAHLTFQEYFAAFELRGRVRHFDELAQTCAELVDNRYWHETLNVLFEMLTEFHGAGDELFDVIEEQAKDKESAAVFFSALLLDEQNGLSPGKQERAAQIALDRTCDEFNDSIIKNLRQLAPSPFSQLVTQPLLQQLQTAQPKALGRDFFLVGDELLEWWPRQVAENLRQRSNLPWSIEQIYDIVLVGTGAKEIIAWAAEHLPLPSWVESISFWWSEAISLIELNLTPVFNSHGLSARHLLLAQAGLALASRNSIIIRITPLSCDNFARDRDLGLAQALARGWIRYRGRTRTRDWIRYLALAQDWERAKARDSAQVLIEALDWDQSLARDRDWNLVRERGLIYSLARNLSSVIESPRLEQPEETIDDLVAVGADVEWLVFQPDREQERVAVINRLQEFLPAADDWTHLQVINYLIALGAGTPELCAEMNQLLDRALQEPESFTFPDNLHEVIASQEFITKEFPEAIKIIFLHEPGDPLLKPEWFDPASEEARFLRASPREFFALAAEVLDPAGETELAKWRKS